MAELQERHKVWAEREGLYEVGHLPSAHTQRAVARSLATMDRAVSLFEAVHEALGDRAWIDPEGGGTRRRLYLRDRRHRDWLLPVPLLEHAWVPDLGRHTVATFVNSNAVAPEDAPEDWKPGDPPWWPQEIEPDILPQNEHMRGGSLKIAEGTGYVELKYDDRGYRSESVWSRGGDTFWHARAFNTRRWMIDPLSRPPTPLPFSMALRPELDLAGHSVEELTGWVLELEPERLLPHRVLAPLPMPGGVVGCWNRARRALREACFDGRLDAVEAGWVVVDAFEGTALATGPTFEEAVRRWLEEVDRVRPRPPRRRGRDRGEEPGGGEGEGEGGQRPPTPPPDEPPRLVEDEERKAAWFSSGTIRIESAPLAELAWPIPLPQHVPAVALPLSPRPPLPEAFRRAGFQRMLRMVGEHGEVSHGALREEADGFTVVGGGVLDIVDPSGLAEEIQVALDAQRAWYAEAPEGFPNPFAGSHAAEIHTFRCWDDARRQRAPLKHASGSWGGFVADSVQGDDWNWRVARVWREE